MAFSAAVAPTLAGEPDPRIGRLTAAARDLANETGRAAFTVAQVAERAGLSLKSFYRCFPGKDDLLVALLADDSALGAELLEARIAARDGDRLEAFVDELFTLLTLPAADGYAGVLVREHTRLSETHPTELRVALAPLTDLLASFLTTADPRRDAETTFGVLLRGIHDVVLGHVPDARAHGAYLYRFCAHGLDGC
jgi:AcrR family transcriptional regulator